MKKTTKRIFSLFMALTLLLITGLSTNMAYAEEDGSEKGSITIKDAKENEKYAYLQLFGLTYSGEGDKKTYAYYPAPYEYQIYEDMEEKGFLIPKTDKNSKEEEELNTVNINGEIKYINITEKNKAEFLKLLEDSIFRMTYEEIDPGLSNDGNGDLTVEGLPLGYYIVWSTSKNQPSDKNKSVFTLTSTKPHAEIKIKSEHPTIKKVISPNNKKNDEKIFDLGEDIPFEITGKVPYTIGFDRPPMGGAHRMAKFNLQNVPNSEFEEGPRPYEYIITDTLSDGLTLDKDSVKVSIDGKDESKNEHVKIDTNKDQTIVVNIDMHQFQDKVGEEVKVTYTAYLNEKAVIGKEGNNNSATLTYSHYSDYEVKKITTTPVEVKVYTGEVSIFKFTGGKAKTPLKDAEFILTLSDGSERLYYKLTKENGKDTVSWVEYIDEATRLKSDDKGNVKFTGIREHPDTGSYYLEEVKAPEGYNGLAKPEEITDLKANDITKGTGRKHINIENRSGTVLPETGGMGTKLFTIVGSGLILLAGYSLMKNKAEEKEK